MPGFLGVCVSNLILVSEKLVTLSDCHPAIFTDSGLSLALNKVDSKTNIDEETVIKMLID